MNIRLARPLCGDGVDQRAAAAVFTPTQPPRARPWAFLIGNKVKKIFIECKGLFTNDIGWHFYLMTLSPSPSSFVIFLSYH